MVLVRNRGSRVTGHNGTDHKQVYWSRTDTGTGHRHGYWSQAGATLWSVVSSSGTGQRQGVAVVLVRDRGSSGTGQRQG